MADLAARAPISTDEQRLRAEVAEHDEARFIAVLDDAVAAVEAAGLPYLLMGGIAAACHGRPRWTHDVDLLVRPTDARAGADLVVHGHAHAGSEKGVTPGGVPVRNVAQPVLRRAYALLCLDGRRRAVGSGAPPPRPPWGATGAHGHLPTPVGRHTRPHASW